MNKSMRNTSWRDLIGIWRSFSVKEITYDFTILEKGEYELFSFPEKKRCSGKIESAYLEKSNTIHLILTNCFSIELYQFVDKNIILVINGKKFEFSKIDISTK